MKKETIIPKHVAIILDGNRRWAKKKGIAKYLGHQAGANNIINIVKHANFLGIRYLSLYCFSTENIKRDKEEIEYLFSLPNTYFDKYIEDIKKDNIKIIFSGDISILPKKSYESCLNALNVSKNNTGLILNFCFNYGARSELIKVIKEVATEYKDNKISLNEINENLVNKHLYTNELSDVDLLIRPGKEKRLSNFLLWQSSYAELYFLNKYWPAFNIKDLNKAIKEFNKRHRRLGR